MADPTDDAIPSAEGPDAQRDPAAADAQPRLSGRTWLVIGIGVVAAVALGVVLVPSPDAPGPGGTTVACEGGSAQPLAQGLTPEPGPDSLPPAVLCDFDVDEGVDVGTLLGGEPLVVNFWATWCPPCVEEMPDFQALHEAGDGRIRVVGINTQDAPRRARPFVEELGITYDQLRDPMGQYFEANAGFGMPTTLFVMPDGAIAFRHTGPLSLQEMSELVAEHLGVDVAV